MDPMAAPLKMSIAAMITGRAIHMPMIGITAEPNHSEDLDVR
jgi:hypothetical protein